MGGAVPVGDTFDEAACRQLLGKRFDPEVFQQLSGLNGLVSRDKLIAALKQGGEKPHPGPYEWKKAVRCLCCPRVDSRRLPLMDSCAELRADLLKERGIEVSTTCLTEHAGFTRKITYASATPHAGTTGWVYGDEMTLLQRVYGLLR